MLNLNKVTVNKAIQINKTLMNFQKTQYLTFAITNNSINNNKLKMIRLSIKYLKNKI